MNTYSYCYHSHTTSCEALNFEENFCHYISMYLYVPLPRRFFFFLKSTDNHFLIAGKVLNIWLIKLKTMMIYSIYNVGKDRTIIVIFPNDIPKFMRLISQQALRIVCMLPLLFQAAELFLQPFFFSSKEFLMSILHFLHIEQYCIWGT